MRARQCPRCRKINEGDLDFCIYCGTYFEDESANDEDSNVFFILHKNDGEDSKKTVVKLNEMPDDVHIPQRKQSHRLAILLGYLFAILGGLLGFVFAIYLLTRKDKRARRHGLVQLVILIVEYIMIAVFIFNGQLDMNMLLDPFNMTHMNNNMSSMFNTSQMNITGSNNMSSLFGF
ncbi:MAG: hypothetical protein IJP12_03960 [Methanobrevibacter sp.]|nr:hypothetical protein [Methanobrevibacter sp.]